MVPTIRILGTMRTGTTAGTTLGTRPRTLGQAMTGGARVQKVPIGGAGAQEVHPVADRAAGDREYDGRNRCALYP